MELTKEILELLLVTAQIILMVVEANKSRLK